MTRDQGKLLPFRRVPGTEDGLSDAALVAACALRDRAALGALYDRFHVGVYRFLSRFLGSAGAEIDDLVQSTFIEVERSAPRFRGGSAVRTWIFGISANLARHHVRSERRRGAMLGAVARERSSQSSGPRPDDSVEKRQLMAKLAAALAELSHDHRVAFVMCDLEEIPGVEAARALGLRNGTLWRRLHEARQKLRAALEGGA